MAVGYLFVGFDLEMSGWWVDGDGHFAVGFGRTSSSMLGRSLPWLPPCFLLSFLLPLLFFYRRLLVVVLTWVTSVDR